MNPRNPREMMGFETPGDQQVKLPIRVWSAVKLALWRNKGGWEIAMHSAIDIINRCTHVDGCPGIEDETEPCLPNRYAKEPQGTNESDEAYAARLTYLVQKGCPDREQRMNALVILNAARMFAPADARRPANEPYSAPSREYFSEIIGTLLAAQAELEALHAVGVTAAPPPNPETSFLTQRAPPQFSPADFEEKPEDQEEAAS
jgi:hypothetical protein